MGETSGDMLGEISWQVSEIADTCLNGQGNSNNGRVMSMIKALDNAKSGMLDLRLAFKQFTKKGRSRRGSLQASTRLRALAKNLPGSPSKPNRRRRRMSLRASVREEKRARSISAEREPRRSGGNLASLV